MDVIQGSCQEVPITPQNLSAEGQNSENSATAPEDSRDEDRVEEIDLTGDSPPLSPEMNIVVESFCSELLEKDVSYNFIEDSIPGELDINNYSTVERDSPEPILETFNSVSVSTGFEIPSHQDSTEHFDFSMKISSPANIQDIDIFSSESSSEEFSSYCSSCDECISKSIELRSSTLLRKHFRAKPPEPSSESDIRTGFKNLSGSHPAPKVNAAPRNRCRDEECGAKTSADKTSARTDHKTSVIVRNQSKTTDLRFKISKNSYQKIKSKSTISKESSSEVICTEQTSFCLSKKSTENATPTDIFFNCSKTNSHKRGTHSKEESHFAEAGTQDPEHRVVHTNEKTISGDNTQKLTHAKRKGPSVDSSATTIKYDISSDSSISHALHRSVFKCIECHFFSHEKEDIVNHSRTAHTNALKCAVCDFEMDNNNEYFSHLKKHFDGPQCFCPYCDFQSSNVKNLARHVSRHLKNKFFKCNICTFYCRSAPALKKHKQHHKTGGIFKCTFCRRGYRRICLLRKHMQICIYPGKSTPPKVK